jgi:hypothetical protein
VDDERRALVILRVVAALVAVPAWSIGLAFILTAPGDHVFHMASMVVAGIAAAVIWFAAPGIAKRISGEATQT